MSFKNYCEEFILEGETSQGKLVALRGFTIIESLDLNLLSSAFFKSQAIQNVKKFGFFSCTGGHVKLVISIPRTAFVCGEYIHFEGKSQLNIVINHFGINLC